MLNLSGNKLSVLPDEIGQLVKLEHLGLNENHLKKLPTTVGALKVSVPTCGQYCVFFLFLFLFFLLTRTLQNLRTLDCRFNRMAKIPDEVCLLGNLVKLFLRFNKLTELPQPIGKMSNLEVLSVRSNRLTAIPESVNELRKLETLDLQHNKIQALPPLGNLQRLTELDVQYNHLEAVSDIGKLTNLERLHLKYNRLQKIPDNMLGVMVKVALSSSTLFCLLTRFRSTSWTWRATSSSPSPRTLVWCVPFRCWWVHFSHRLVSSFVI